MCGTTFFDVLADQMSRRPGADRRWNGQELAAALPHLKVDQDPFALLKEVSHLLQTEMAVDSTWSSLKGTPLALSGWVWVRPRAGPRDTPVLFPTVPLPPSPTAFRSLSVYS